MSDATDARDKAIKRVGGRDPGWMIRAATAVKKCALSEDFFTTDDVIGYLKPDDVPRRIGGLWVPVEPRAWGAVMRVCHERRTCVPTGRYVASSRVASHARPKMEWQSLIG